MFGGGVVWARCPYLLRGQRRRVRGYGKDAIPSYEGCVEGCVGMARMPYPPTLLLYFKENLCEWSISFGSSALSSSSLLIKPCSITMSYTERPVA